MHVLLALDVWGFAGGTERYAAAVVPALIGRGHRVTVLCREDRRPDPTRLGIPAGARVDVLEEPALAGQGLAPEARGRLADGVRAAAPDVVYLSAMRNHDGVETLLDLAPMVRFVHDHTLFCPGLNKVRADGETCREPMGLECLRRYYLDAGCHGFEPSMFAGRPLAPLRRVLHGRRGLALGRRAARVLTSSDYMRAQLLAVGFRPEHVSVLRLFTLSHTPAQPAGPLPAETEAFLAASGEPLVFTPARLTLPDKGVDHLLEALSLVRSGFRAVVSGEGPAEAWLHDEARRVGVAERVCFSGWLSSEAVETLYARSSVVVCPSVWDEPFGLVGLEAMAHGKPVVAFGVGGIPEWLQDGENGLLVARKDAGAMAAAIDRLLGDPELARELGRRGSRILRERFPREVHVEGLERVLAAAGTTAAARPCTSSSS